jgi:DNA polymerase zeta
MLFRTQNLSEIKAYLQRQWRAILAGRAPVADFVFAKEVRLGTYSARGPLPPAALVAAHRLGTDPRAEARYGERVRYVVVHGGPRARLIDLVVPPEQLLHDRCVPRPGPGHIHV